jgi:hypothetical protein
MFVVAFGLGWYIMKIFEREGESLKARLSFYMDSFSYVKVLDTSLYDWEYFAITPRNPLPIREDAGLFLFGFIPGWDFTGFQG